MSSEAPAPGRLLAFGRFRFDTQTVRLFDEHGVLVPGPSKAFETLRALLEHRERVISKDELMALVWPDTVVEEANLAQQVFTLRRLLGDEAGHPAFIATLPRRGYRFVGDVTEVSTPPARVSPAAVVGDTAGSTPRQARWRIAVAAVVLVSAVALASRWTTNPGLDRRAIAFDLVMPPGVVARPDLGLAGVSPDGRRLALIAQRAGEAPAIWLRELGGSDPFPLTGSDGGRFPFWSPDGSALGFFQNSHLRAIAVGGGPPRDVCAARGGRGGTWNADGTIVFAPDARSPLLAVAAAGGTPRPVTTLDAGRLDVSHRYPSFLPDGRHFVFLVWSGDVDREGVYVGSLDGTAPVRLLPDLSPAVWTAGQLVFVRRETLVAQEMAGTRPSGEVRAVAARVGRDPSDYVALAASASGDLVFQRGEQRTELVWFDRAGRRLGTFGPAAHWADPAIAPDGTRVAFIHRDRAAGDENLDIWIDDGARHMRTRITQDPAIDVLPVWSPDGRELLFRSNRSGFSDLYRKRLDTATPESLLVASATRKDPTDWSRDGRWILFTEMPSSGPTEIWMAASDGKTPGHPIVKERAGGANGRFSPDARYVAFESAPSGSHEVYVQALAADGRRWRISANGGTEPAWRADGRELFFLSGDDINAVDVTRAADGLAFGTPHVLFHAPAFAWLRNAMAVSPDGQRFLLSVAVDEPRPIEVVLNWRGRAMITAITTPAR
jgi:Tol biopolymer transport system component/DNA-binding winged helix-turn-helix (wHTH) protein